MCKYFFFTLVSVMSLTPYCMCHVIPQLGLMGVLHLPLILGTSFNLKLHV